MSDHVPVSARVTLDLSLAEVEALRIALAGVADVEALCTALAHGGRANMQSFYRERLEPLRHKLDLAVLEANDARVPTRTATRTALR